MNDDTRTSEPGTGSDPLEADFEQHLADTGVTLEGRELPPSKVQPKPDLEAEAKAKADADAKVAADKKAADEATAKKKEEDGKTKPEMEPWRKAVAKKHEDKAKSKDEEIERLRTENAALKKNPNPPAPSQPADPTKPEASVLNDDQKKLAEKYGIEPEDFLKMFPTKEVIREVVKSGLSAEQEVLLNTINSEREQNAISQGYDVDFTKNVLPLIKAEYPHISDEKVAEIKSKIFDKIQTDAYSMTPLQTLYKGEDEFRGVVTIPRKSMDEGSKVPGNNGQKVYDFENVTDTDLRDPNFPFEKYSDYKASQERGTKRK